MKKRTIITFIVSSCILLPICIVNIAFAQKSSGSIQAQIESAAPPPVSNSIPPLIRANSNLNQSNISKNEVRFLLRPKNEAEVAAQMAGVISSIKFKVGQRFKKGDVLVSISCADRNAKAQAQKAKVKEAELTHRSNIELKAGNAVSQFEVDISGAQLEYQKALLSESQIQASYCRVYSPFSGGVVSVDANVYETVSIGQPLLTIIDDSALVMSLNIPSAYINKVKQGNVFSIVVDETNKTYKAKVLGISPAIDPVSKTIELRAELVETNTELKPGMSGKANLDFSAG